MVHARHGHTKSVNGKKVISPEFRSWKSMRDRCLREGHGHYYGMPVDEIWKFSFEQFLLDMGPKPDPSYTIDRIKGDQGYFPDNCRWATMAEQSRNKSNNAFPGKSVEDVAREAGVSVQMVRGRIAKGWPRELWLDPKATYKIKRFSDAEKDYIIASPKSTRELADEMDAKYEAVFYIRKYSERAKNG